MLNKHTLFTLALLCSAPAFAIPIESRGLSQQDNSYTTATAINISNANVEDTPITNTNINWQLIQKIERLESDLRGLRGKIEEQDNEINQIKNDLQNRYTDLDQRLELLTEKINSDAAADTEEDNQQDTKEDNQQDTSPSTTDTVNQTAVATPPTKTSSSTSNTVSPDEAAYTVALEAYQQGGAIKALAPMQSFIKNNPNSPYISNAHYWLAEFYLGIDPANYPEAQKNYETVLRTYPNSAKASRAVYRLYSIAQNVDHNSVQAALYKNILLQKYPKSEEADFIKSK